MPALNELHRAARQRQDFAIVSVTLESDSSMPRLRKLLKQYQPSYPVLKCDDLGPSNDCYEPCGWEIPFLSYALWLNPQGVIVARTGFRDKDEYKPILAELDFLKELWAEKPILALDVNSQQHEDRSVTFTVNVSNSTHTPLEVRYGAWWRMPRESGSDICEVWPDWQYEQVKFGEFGDYSFTVDIGPKDAAEGTYCFAEVDYPGADILYDGEGLFMVADCDAHYPQPNAPGQTE